MFNKIKIVRFNDGTYGVRKGWLFYSFLNIRDATFWWPMWYSRWNDVLKYIKMSSENQARLLLDKYEQQQMRKKDKGTPVK